MGGSPRGWLVGVPLEALQRGPLPASALAGNGVAVRFPEKPGPMMKPTIVGAHHKTGSVLSWEIVKLLTEFVGGRPKDAVRFADIPNWLRKEPLSYALEHSPRALFRRNIWCEHQIDVSGIKFLHFVRHPMPRIASGYLYHKRGAPTDVIRWPDWPIFDFRGRKCYIELLNALDIREGLLVEAIRTYPEALGSARAYASAARLPAGENLPVWLEHFEHRPLDSLTAIYKFVYGDADGRLADFLAKAESRDIVLREDSAAYRRHVTRNDTGRRTIEETIASSAEIARLYDDIARKMGAAPMTSRGEQAGPLSDIFDDLKSKSHFLLMSPRSAQDSGEFWRDPAAGSIWQTFALSNFANGHLMMQPYIQALLSRLA